MRVPREDILLLCILIEAATPCSKNCDSAPQFPSRAESNSLTVASNRLLRFFPCLPSFLALSLGSQYTDSLTLRLRKRTEMLLVRDFVAHIANEVVKRLVDGGHIETKAAQAVVTRVRQRMLEELTVEDRLNEEVRQILIERQDEMRSTGVSYQEMYKKVKQHLARDRKLILR
jgi:Protein of unknown function (DUF507)